MENGGENIIDYPIKMRNKPLFKPVVEAIERQEAVNRFLLDQINELRAGFGLESISPSTILGVIDGNDNLKDNPANDIGNLNPTPPVPIPNPLPKENTSIRKYSESLMATSVGLGLYCDDYDLMDGEDAYVFDNGSDVGEFTLNPHFAHELLKKSRRVEWEKVVKCEPEEIPDLTEGKKYVMDVVKPGKTRLIDGCWVIMEPAEIRITLGEK